MPNNGEIDLEQLISSVDIVEYISQFVELNKVGDEWWGLSCFKDENTPSFSVRQDPPVFYDYSSGIGGGLITFIKRYFRCSGGKAVQMVLDYLGMSGKQIAIRKRMSAVADCKKYKRNDKVRKAIKQTILPSNYMDRYEKRWDKLLEWEKEGISRDVMAEFQVYYDGFSDRIVYPIRNLDGEIVNVGGRTLSPTWKEDKQRKYTYFFGWGQMKVIYGLFENMKDIMEKCEVIIFEGCKSVLLAMTWGITNCGAILTSHLGKDQWKILAGLGVRVVFALDKDIKIEEDENIARLSNYVNCEYIWDKNDVLDSKDAPVDKGESVFKTLYDNRVKLRYNKRRVT